MANENTRYTHIIEKCCPLLRALCYDTLARYTGETLSRTYWRIREGKGLLTYQDKANLDRWSKQITSVRRFFSSPLSISVDQYEELRVVRDTILERMEKYRDWLAYGSKPVYLTQVADHDYALTTLNFTLSKMFDEYVKENETEDVDATPYLKEFWQSLNIEHLLARDSEVFEDLKPIFLLAENDDKYNADEAFVLKGYKYLEYTKVWQIRTDMDNRSSKMANINGIMNWLWEVPTKSEGHELCMEDNDTLIRNIVEWKNVIKEDQKRRKALGGSFSPEEKDEVFCHIMDGLKTLRVPDFPQDWKKED